jgi:hypothetical protein
MRISSLRHLLRFGLVLAAAVTLFAQALTVKDIIRLKKLGFSDAEVKTEVAKAGRPITATPAEIQALRDAGAGDELIKALQAPAAGAKPVTLADVVRMTRSKRTADQILEVLIASGAKYAVSAGEATELIRQGVAAPVILALKGKPLGLNELKVLGENKCTEESYASLETLVGFEPLDLTPADVLALDRAGVPDRFIVYLRQPAAKAQGGLGGLQNQGAKPGQAGQQGQAAQPQPPVNPPAPVPVVNEHPAELIGTWQGEITGDFVNQSCQLVFTAEGRFVLTMQMGAFLRGRWSTEQNALFLTADNGVPEAETYEFVDGKLKIITKMGVILVQKIR